jgi:hypothetical protein
MNRGNFLEDELAPRGGVGPHGVNFDPRCDPFFSSIVVNTF